MRLIRHCKKFSKGTIRWHILPNQCEALCPEKNTERIELFFDGTPPVTSHQHVGSKIWKTFFTWHTSSMSPLILCVRSSLFSINYLKKKSFSSHYTPNMVFRFVFEQPTSVCHFQFLLLCVLKKTVSAFRSSWSEDALFFSPYKTRNVHHPKHQSPQKKIRGLRLFFGSSERNAIGTLESGE